MKRTMIVLGVALAGALMSASAQVSFTHLKSVDLSSYFPAGGEGAAAPPPSTGEVGRGSMLKNKRKDTYYAASCCNASRATRLSGSYSSTCW